MHPSITIEVFHGHMRASFTGVFIQLMLGLLSTELCTVESVDCDALISMALLFLLEAD